ncbi:hypothetical protein A11S_1830 [Micavibrio aeruginosavorus EPB]|uniref:Uncharacterized protein n=1 Tax=Micavibrio aeruginosavorus EPB TaxID=349215 RepID=M4VGY5_9BACT|nr:hypothetical protein A11S_1830 [Micavibrio aeruginosavorus EPB]
MLRQRQLNHDGRRHIEVCWKNPPVEYSIKQYKSGAVTLPLKYAFAGAKKRRKNALFL